jgi:hypothetical protein
MRVYNSFNFKLLFILLLIISIGLPINNSIDLIIILFGIFFIKIVKIKESIKLNIYKIILLIVITLIPNFITNKNIEEAHSSFFSNADIKILSDFLPKNIIIHIKNNYINTFDIDRALEASHIFNEKNKFNQHNFIVNPYSFSSDNFFTRSKYSRFVEKINFKNREDLRLGQFNSLSYNLPYDKEFRRMIPYYVLYKIPNSFYNSTLCAKGNTFFGYSNKELININEIVLNKFEKDCININSNLKYLYVLGYSINKQDNLEIKLEKNTSNFFLNIIKIILQLILFVFFYRFIFNFKTISKIYISTLFISLFVSIIFIFFKDLNLLTGLRYFRGGADGLFHEFQGTEIVRNLFNFNFYETFRGGADVFYFMPGLRYFIAINKIIFGDTSFGYVIVGFLLPFYLYVFLKNIISEKISFYILISFLIFPIFENMGFGHFNYIHQIVRNHAETLSITIIIFSLAKISSSKFIIKMNYLKVFYYCFLLSFATFCRPNFLPTTSIIFLYILYVSFNKNYILSLVALIGYSFVFLSLFHNLYYGDNFSLFTKSNVHFVFNDIFQSLNNNNVKNNIIINQILKWNPLYNFHRLIIFTLVIVFFLKNERNLIISILFTSTISQHLVLFLTHPDGRYAYLAWMLTLICFFYYIFNIYLKKFK